MDSSTALYPNVLNSNEINERAGESEAEDEDEEIYYIENINNEEHELMEKSINGSSNRKHYNMYNGNVRDGTVSGGGGGSGGIRQYLVFNETKMVQRVDSEFELILNKLKNIWKLRQSAKIEGYCAVSVGGDYVIKIGNIMVGTSYKGMLIQAEYYLPNRQGLGGYNECKILLDELVYSHLFSFLDNSNSNSNSNSNNNNNSNNSGNKGGSGSAKRILRKADIKTGGTERDEMLVPLQYVLIFTDNNIL
ncbi:hypothetical protein AX774_g2422 [Zancudomyces culisetae]|uniref:Mediator of RNA polymerase II transcription subunit 20 n=1 Tax=Zancudomyces culisetae TaxID=1213189 RepID=A0A1R1PT35_ZANCU|nr:hypothetical protein AX774_g2422 [Zancudomyces culisetae]|eukprot:OMH84063.1 hypothetical protein AX774_g2422 [Zancudomyces culisetae]